MRPAARTFTDPIEPMDLANMRQNGVRSLASHRRGVRVRPVNHFEGRCHPHPVRLYKRTTLVRSGRPAACRWVGGTGTGKTHLAIAIARSCIRAGSRGGFYKPPPTPPLAARPC
jgi:hypothetical protein